MRLSAISINDNRSGSDRLTHKDRPAAKVCKKVTDVDAAAANYYSPSVDTAAKESGPGEPTLEVDATTPDEVY